MIDATDFGDVSQLRDEPDGSGVRTKVGGYCVIGTATSAMNPGDAVVIDTAADDSYKTTTSANATIGGGFVVAGMGNGMQWDYVSAIASGKLILIRVAGVVLATASAAITRGDRVGTSTTAGRVATTTTAGAGLGRALQQPTVAGQTFRVLLGRS
jgi:hypothetical protein